MIFANIVLSNFFNRQFNARLMNVPSLLRFFPQFPLLSCLREAERAQLEAAAKWRTSRKNSLIYLADEPTDHLYFLVKGAVKLGVFLPDGRTMVRNIELPGAMFGESGLLGEARRGEYARSLNQPVDYFIVRIADFQEIMRQNFELTTGVLHFFGERLRRAERQRQALVNKDVRARIVDFIKENAALRQPQAGLERLSLHGLTQAEIANLVGASRQTVTAVLNELRKMNLINFSRNDISIRDRENLN